MEDQPSLLEQAKSVLEQNDQGSYTIPAAGLYPHQWLWDSCFISVGMRHLDIERAKSEIYSLMRGQWSNGMLPHVIHSGMKHARDADIWRSWTNPAAPENLSTSGITQPPVVAEAVYRVGQKMKLHERRSWYKSIFPYLLKYHQWLHTERDPHDEGLTIQIHPWETGLDNTPPWMREIKDHQMPVWIQVIEKLRLGPVLSLFRRDTKFIPAEQRMTMIEALVLYSTQRRLRRKQYNIDRILTHSLFAIEDLSFNCILIRNDKLLVDIAKTIRAEIPAELLKSMRKTEKALEQLWDPYSNQYYSRNFVTHELIKEPTIATLMPFYAGEVDKTRAEALIRHLEDPNMFGPQFPVPTVPLNSNWYKPYTYWQGPTWVNTNWMIIDGLRRNGYKDHADALRESTLEMVELGGFHEYFNPESGEPVGVGHFSWTAALTIDLLKKQS